MELNNSEAQIGSSNSKDQTLRENNSRQEENSSTSIFSSPLQPNSPPPPLPKKSILQQKNHRYRKLTLIDEETSDSEIEEVIASTSQSSRDKSKKNVLCTQPNFSFYNNPNKKKGKVEEFEQFDNEIFEALADFDT
jgi:hypothetical protein